MTEITESIYKTTLPGARAKRLGSKPPARKVGRQSGL
jgi:hypothetical protein